MFQVLIGILEPSSLYALDVNLVLVSSPYRYSRTSLRHCNPLTRLGFQVLIGILEHDTLIQLKNENKCFKSL